MSAEQDLLVRNWLEAKEAEATAKDTRLEIEGKMLAKLGKPEDFTGTEKIGGLKATFKMSESIDAEALKEAAYSAGITSERLGELFRWKPSKDAKAWKGATDKERAILSQAFTIKPAKPAFTIDKGKSK